MHEYEVTLLRLATGRNTVDYTASYIIQQEVVYLCIHSTRFMFVCIVLLHFISPFQSIC